MQNTMSRGVAQSGCDRRASRIARTSLFAFLLPALFAGAILALIQDARAAVPATEPSPGKALVYIYRVGRFVGSAAHDHLYVNGKYLAYLKNSEYAGTEVDPGTVVVVGLPEMYYGGIIQSTGAALNDARKKENERIRFEAEAGKTYYLKWTSGAMATGIKVTMMDPATGAKEMGKLHLSKPVEQPEAKK